MKEIIIKILSFFSLLIPIKFLIRITGINVIYPFYHIINDNPPAHIKHLYNVKTTKQFREDLDFLTKYFKNTTEINTNLKSDNPKFILSFDDGLQECYSIIAPILKEYGIKANFFINSGFADNIDLFFRYKASIIIDNLLSKNISYNSITKIKKLLNSEKIIEKIKSLKYKDNELLNETAKVLNIDFAEYLKENKPYLTNSQIKELIIEGHKIGSHSINHTLYSELNEGEQIYQTSESIKFITENFKVDYKLFAFPFTDDKVKTSFFDKIYSEKIIDYSFGTAGIKKDIITNNIQRIPLENRNISAKRYIKTEYLLYFFKKVFGNCKVNRK